MTSESNPNRFFLPEILALAHLSDAEHFVLQLSENLTQVSSFIKLREQAD